MLPTLEIVRRRLRGVAWVGNWGDEERTAQLRECFIEPARSLGLSARVHGTPLPASLSPGARPHWYRVRRLSFQFPRSGPPSLPYRRRFISRTFPMFGCCRASRSSGLSKRSPVDSSGVGATGGQRGFASASPGFSDGRQLRKLRRHLDAVSPDRETLACYGRKEIETRHSCAHRVDGLISICGAFGRDLHSPGTVAAQ